PRKGEYMESVAALAGRYGLAVHLDGARIFNAAVALGVAVTDLTLGADSVAFCISKGLAAPVGSLVCGTQEFIRQARRTRKQLGGGMRQAGVLAAAGIVALDGMIERLAEDHRNARLLAEEMAGIKGLLVEPQRVHTNIVYCELASQHLTQAEFLGRLKERGVRVSVTGKNRFRMLSHYGISREDIFTAVTVIREVMTGRGGAPA
ncbi:MAG: GntG family PLP-dependent aldolase, partial [Smithellaceae bacterium]|nr:GntG family PLP-dependent aldolase [Smithellaceae bacterium]